jgi:uncharacterized protein YrzB (UPF0473 family)
MEDKKNLIPDGDEPLIVTLTDEETGEDLDFELIADETVDGKNYFALLPVNDTNGEYYIFEYREDGDDLILETIEDDDEYDKLEDYFNDLLFGEVDYDEGNQG